MPITDKNTLLASVLPSIAPFLDMPELKKVPLVSKAWSKSQSIFNTNIKTITANFLEPNMTIVFSPIPEDLAPKTFYIEIETSVEEEPTAVKFAFINLFDQPIKKSYLQ